MPKYEVVFPVAGVASAIVEAENEENAIKKAVEKWNGDTEELEAFDKIIEGNLRNAPLLKAEATELTEEE